MPTGSIIELYTLILGWYIYDGFWAIISETGLVLIPFIVVVISTLIDDPENGRKVTSSELIGKIEFRLYPMIAVVFFACAPLINIYPENTRFSNMSCVASDDGDNLYRATTDHEAFDSGSTYDQQTERFSVMINNRIPAAPLWWYVWTSLNQAIAHSAKEELPCQPNMRVVMWGMANIGIGDRDLRRETARFYHDCWEPSANKLFREQPVIPPSYREGFDLDVSWAGSRYFLNLDGYYNSFRTTESLIEFPYNETRDASVAPPDYNDGGGWPTCNVWWSDDTFGLRTRLVDDLRGGNWTLDCDANRCLGPFFRYLATRWFGSETEAENVLLRSAISMDAFQHNLSMSRAYTDQWQVMSLLRQLVTTTGLAAKTVGSSVEAEVLRMGAPIVQALVLLVFTCVLPILLTLGLYSVQNLVTLTILQFSIIFWTYLFALAHWLDNFFLEALVSQNDASAALYFITMPFVSGAEQTASELLIIKWITRFMYIFLPIIFSTLMGAVSVSAGSRLSMMGEAMLSGPKTAGGTYAKKNPFPKGKKVQK